LIVVQSSTEERKLHDRISNECAYERQRWFSMYSIENENDDRIRVTDVNTMLIRWLSLSRDTTWLSVQVTYSLSKTSHTEIEASVKGNESNIDDNVHGELSYVSYMCVYQLNWDRFLWARRTRQLFMMLFNRMCTTIY
jgi:hypothetical protein